MSDHDMSPNAGFEGDDLMKRLRAGEPGPMLLEAADEIERLKTELADCKDDYLRVHNEKVDRLERAIAAEAQIARHQAEWEQATSRAEAAEAELSKLDAVVHVLEIEDSYEDPAECVKALKAREAALRAALAWYADAVQRIAHRMPAPNEFTLIFTQLAIDMRQTLFNTKDKSDG